MILSIEASRIVPHPNNPRSELGDLTELAASIKENGILQNLTVVPKDMDLYQKKISAKKAYTGEYTAIIGHRRLAAAVQAGLTEVPCAVIEMDEKTQVATMLLENIQRNDLTPYEQAQGFQLMLDLGDTVDDVAQRTGISTTTIRRRVKWAELDKEKFQESIERGGTIADYDALNKIKDLKRRNKVLAKIGTDNFQWELKSAVSEEKRAENSAVIVETLASFAMKIEESESSKYQYVSCISFDNENYQKPDDADTVKYFYSVSRGSAYLYTVRKEREVPQKTPEQIAREERHKQINGLFDRAYELRFAFIKSFHPSSKQIELIEKKSIEILFLSYTRPDEDLFRGIFGVKGKFRPDWQSSEKGGETYKEAAARILNENKDTSASTLLFTILYCHLDKPSYSCVGYDGRFSLNKTLESSYEFLTSLGYQMSDEEKTLLDGTHELYEPPREDGGEDDDDEYYDEDEEDNEDEDYDDEQEDDE